MRLNLDHKYYDSVGNTRLSVRSQAELEEWLVDQAAQNTGWTWDEIRASFAPDRYLWNRTIRSALSLLVYEINHHNIHMPPRKLEE